MSSKQFQKILYIEQFLVKGWEIGILLLLPFLQIKGEITLVELGILSTVLSISQFGTSIVSGYVLQKVGNNKIMMLSAILATLPWAMLSFRPSLLIMILLYFIAGASTGLFETFAISTTATNLAKGNRSEGLANLGMMGDAGRILFTGATTLLVLNMGVINFSIMNTLAGMILIVVLFYFANNNRSEELKNASIKLSHLRGYFEDKKLVLALIVGCIDSFSSASLFIFLPLLFRFKGLPYDESGVLSILLFVGYMLGRKVLGKTADKFGTIKTLMAGETFMAIIIIAITVTNNFWILIGLLLLLGVAARGTSPVCKALVVDAIPDHMSTENGVSIYISGARLANIISRPVFSGVVGVFGIVWVFGLSAISSLLINIPLYKSK